MNGQIDKRVRPAGTNPKADLLHVLDQADEPLNLDEISRRLALSFRFVAYMLVEGCQNGTVERIEGGFYVRSRRRREEMRHSSESREQLRQLFEVVLACEAEWRLDDRLDYMDRVSCRRRA
jgi:hypothetical protein